MNTETIFTSYQPVARYWQMVELAIGAKPTPSVALRGIDVFLIKQIATYYPTPPQVLDLAASATLGASSAAWAAPEAATMRVITPHAPSAEEWQDWLARYLKGLAAEAEKVHLHTMPSAQTADWQALQPHLDILTPLFVIVALSADFSQREQITQLSALFTAQPFAIFFVLPFGKVGEDEHLTAALQACAANPAFHFRLGREISAMFAASQIGIFYPRINLHLPEILKRLHTLYEGNFNFAALLDDNTALRIRLRQSEVRLAHYEQLISQHAEQLASHQAAQQALEAQLAALAHPPPEATPLALPEPVEIALPPPPPPPLPPLDGKQAPPHRSVVDKVRIGLSGVALRLNQKGAARFFYPRRLNPYAAQIIECAMPEMMVTGEMYDALLNVRNTGIGTWYPAQRTPHCVNISYHWLDSRGKMLLKEGFRTPLPREIAPDEQVVLPFQIVAPNKHGLYRLQVDLVHEGVRWLGEFAEFPSYPIKVVIA
jgi:uncharacterized coiled-coil protein SlyX